MRDKSGQVTIFIIIAIVIVAVVILFFALRKPTAGSEQIPVALEPPYVAFLSCLQDDSFLGIEFLKSQGGYIELPSFEPGSPYMPFSSQLNFLGTSIPYWYYVSGNNIQKEQVPSKEEMEKELEKFIEERIKSCDLSSYSQRGFELSRGEPTAQVSINAGSVDISLEMDLGISSTGENILIKDHSIVVNSRLGGLYDSAKIVYQKEQDELFLENYGVDILRLYAPVDGVEMTCGPLTWDAEKVFNQLGEAIEQNTLALKTQGSSDDYFVVDAGINQDVRFLNSRNWSNNFEVAPSDGRILISSPVGNQPGLGILGFCYVPYHYVYNIGYPVLVQVEDSGEIFQFPVAVVIRGNKPREPIASSAEEVAIPEFCKYKNTIIDVNAYDEEMRPVDVEISYECSETSCYIGSTYQGDLKAYFPQCANGKITARAEGYEDASYEYSTINSGETDIVLDKIYPIAVNLKVDGKNYGKEAVISFISDRASKTVVYPEQKTIGLSQGEYEVQVFVYDNSSLTIEASTSQQCVSVPKSGIGGLLGLTEERCFDIQMPEQIISQALVGGGKTNISVLDSMLKGYDGVEINAESLPKPTSLEQLQLNYILFEDKNLEVDFN